MFGLFKSKQQTVTIKLFEVGSDGKRPMATFTMPTGINIENGDTVTESKVHYKIVGRPQFVSVSGVLKSINYAAKEI